MFIFVLCSGHYLVFIKCEFVVLFLRDQAWKNFAINMIHEWTLSFILPAATKYSWHASDCLIWVKLRWSILFQLFWQIVTTHVLTLHYCAPGERRPSIRGRWNLWRYLLQQRGICNPHVAQLHRRWGLLSHLQLRIVSICVHLIKVHLSLTLCRTSGKEWTAIFWSSNIKMHRRVRKLQEVFEWNSSMNWFPGSLLLRPACLT